MGRGSGDREPGGGHLADRLGHADQRRARRTYLIWVGKRRRSIPDRQRQTRADRLLDQSGRDRRSSLALLTGWLPWDPIAAILVATNIMVSGLGLMRQSVRGLMDLADPEAHQRLSSS